MIPRLQLSLVKEHQDGLLRCAQAVAEVFQTSSSHLDVIPVPL